MSKQNVLSLELACRTSNVTSYATAILEQLLECIPLLWSGAEEESPFGSPLRQETVRRISLNVPQRNECLRDGYCTMVTDRRTDHGIIETFGGHVLLKTKSQFVERSSSSRGTLDSRFRRCTERNCDPGSEILQGVRSRSAAPSREEPRHPIRKVGFQRMLSSDAVGAETSSPSSILVRK